ncbi:MAG TPA: ABC transporter permease [Chloroflexota bacterium]|jgi:peptide/nickel transport system permease protein
MAVAVAATRPRRVSLTSFQRYLLNKVVWFFGAFWAALILNFFLPRLIPGNPVDTLVARLASGGLEGQAAKQVYAAYVAKFGLDQPVWVQFYLYVQGLAHGDLGQSFLLYPAPVRDLIGQALPWTLALQLPAVLVGWIIGNTLGAMAAYRGGWTDRGAFLTALALSSTPYYCLAILLVYLLAVALPIFPPGGGYSYGRTPALTLPFIADALGHYLLPFLSLVAIFVGGQAVGMRSMAIYELGTDYVNYARGLGIGANRVVAYIFRNAMLPQITGLALAIGSLVGGALITEVVFSYPGIGGLLFTAIRQNDYPIIQGITLLITMGVLLANFLVDVTYGLIDPRIRAAQTG